MPTHRHHGDRELQRQSEQNEPLRNYVLFACTFAEKLAERFDRRHLPGDWRENPAPAQLQQIGDSWAQSAVSAVLEVPNVIIETESNFLLNPEHSDFGKITIAEPIPFTLDVRLLRP